MWTLIVRVALAAMLLLQFVACASRSDEATERDVEVLRAVLGHRCSGSSQGYAVLTSEATSPELYAPATGWWTGRRQAAGQMVRRNQSPHQLPIGLECAGVRVVSRQTIDAAFKRNAPPSRPPNPGWEGFYDTFSGATGTAAISLPGYSFSGNIACVYSSGSSGG